MMKRVQQRVRVVDQKKVCPQFFRLRLDAGALAAKVLPGQFIHIRVNEGLEPFFRRPFSVHRADRYLEILYEVVGKGTAMLSQKKKNDVLDILGPLGNSFSLPPAGIKQAVMIAGGIGVAPFMILSDVLKKEKISMTLLYGGRTRGHVFAMSEFKRNGCRVHVATDDGSVGVKGRVPELFGRIEFDPARTFLYTCGPRPMMAAVQEFAVRRGLAGQVSCEERMACGLGACRGCVVRTRSGYQTACYDGPIFDLAEVIF